ncbi:MAG: sensor histidine kinase [Ruminiclostridium sp.]|nr:sensor histidine kinase [Ruminiclostridium sp.]
MNRLLEKCAVILICAAGFVMSDELTAPVIALLAAVTVSAAVQVLGDRTASAVLTACWALSCGFMPIMLCSLPLILYDACCIKRPWLVLPAVSVIPGIDRLGTEQLIIIFVGAATSYIIYRRISVLESTVGKLTALHDDITEKNMQLTSQNRKLADAQDNEARLATLKERNRIAREIHDNVGHMLTRSILQVGALRVINKDEALAEPLEELKNTLDGAMTSIRASVHDLHDNSIDLKKTILDMTSAVDGRFDVTLNYDAGENIPGDIKLCTAGVVKESISNAVKHSNGSRIDIVFREHPAFYQLLVEDNGSCGAMKRGGIGLKNMEDRAAGVGGQITFTPSDSGFRVFMTIPKEAGK